MSQIDTQIWIGNIGDASNQQFLKDNNITHILCCAEEFKNPPGFLYINSKTDQWHYLPIVDDVADSKTEAQFREGAKKLNDWLNAGHKVMVHCYAGMSRSTSVVIAYYILYKGWSFDLAYSHCRQRRLQVNPHPDFVKILRALPQAPVIVQPQLQSCSQPTHHSLPPLPLKDESCSGHHTGSSDAQ